MQIKKDEGRTIIFLTGGGGSGVRTEINFMEVKIKVFA